MLAQKVGQFSFLKEVLNFVCNLGCPFREIKREACNGISTPSRGLPSPLVILCSGAPCLAFLPQTQCHRIPTPPFQRLDIFTTRDTLS